MTRDESQNFSKEVYVFDAVRFVPSRNEVDVDDRTTTLEPRLSKLLYVLCQAQGETVTRDEIMDRVWGDVIVSDVSLTRGISELRKILKDDIQNPRIIGTVRKIGYRMLVQAMLTELPAQKLSKRSLVGRWPWVALATVAALILGWRFGQQSEPIHTPRLKPVAVTTENEGAASVSRRGQVAYAVAGEDGEDLMVWDAKAQQRTRVFSWQRKIWSTAWDPASSVIYVCAEHNAGLAIFKVFPVENVEPILFATIPYSITMGMTVLSGDRVLVSAGSIAEGFRILLVDLMVDKTSVLVDAVPGTLGCVYPGASPDETKLIYAVAESYHKFSIFVSDMDGGKPVEVATPNMSIYDIEWVSKSVIGYLATIEHKPLFYIKAYDREAHFESQLDLGSFVSSLAIRDRHMVVENTHADPDIVIFNKQTGIRRVTDSVLIETDSHYAPNRKEIAYVSTENNQLQIFICGADGSNRRLVPYQGGRLGSPRWSRSEREIAFINRFGDPTSLVIYDLESARTSEVVSDNSVDSVCGFSLDDQEVFVRVRDLDWHGVVGMDRDGNVKRRIENAWKCVELDDGAVVYNRLDQPSVWLLEPGEDPRQIAETSGHVGSSWDVFGRSLFFIGSDYLLQELNLDRGEIVFSQQLNNSPFAIGNMTAVDAQTLCFDHVKNFHGDVYYGVLDGW